MDSSMKMMMNTERLTDYFIYTMSDLATNASMLPMPPPPPVLHQLFERETSSYSSLYSRAFRSFSSLHHRVAEHTYTFIITHNLKQTEKLLRLLRGFLLRFTLLLHQLSLPLVVIVRALLAVRREHGEESSVRHLLPTTFRLFFGDIIIVALLAFLGGGRLGDDFRSRGFLLLRARDGGGERCSRRLGDGEHYIRACLD